MIDNIKAAIIDLDGVITTTAVQHARSWKKMFDQYKDWRKKGGKKTYAPFSIEEDYPRYIDGIPRYKGVEAFLESRNISIPYGDPADEASRETICGLGNWKNKIFLQLIAEEGVGVFEKNVEQIKSWKKQGMKTAVISSSKNCRQILESTGTESLFDTRIDGVVSAERNIKGKPAPDIFLEAARELNVSPENAIVVEDSLAGVEAGKKGNFRLVVGIENASNKEELIKNGADEVVENLQQLVFNDKMPRDPKSLPSALACFSAFTEKLKKDELFLLLDFDGTLAPIVEHFEDAAMRDDMKALLEKLAAEYPVAVISGRGLTDIRDRVGLENIYYAGSHGFEISGPGFHKEKEEAQKTLPVLDALEPILQKELKGIKGVRFERKKFTLAIHYRQVPEEMEKKFMDIINKVLLPYKEVKKGEGKKVVEIRPNINWDKGKAVNLLIQEAAHGKKELSPVYIGDDITDEDVFRTLENGLGILVGEHGRKTYADCRLKNEREVKQLLQQIGDKF